MVSFSSLFPTWTFREVNGVPATGPARQSRNPEFVALARRISVTSVKQCHLHRVRSKIIVKKLK